MSKTAAHNVRTVCPYCGVGCGMILQVANGRVQKVIGDKDHPANFGRLCTKGVSCAEPLALPGRLAFAFTRERRNEEPLPLPIQDALAQTAARLKKIIAEHGPDAVAFYVSGQLSMESQYLAGKLAKGFLRTNNIDSNSRLCMASAASGYKLSLGADGPPGSYQDIDKLNCALVIGSNMQGLYLFKKQQLTTVGKNALNADAFYAIAPYGGAGRKIAFSVLVENGVYGGATAAPAAAEIVNAALKLGLIQP